MSRVLLDQSHPLFVTPGVEPFSTPQYIVALLSAQIIPDRTKHTDADAFTTLSSPLPVALVAALRDVAPNGIGMASLLLTAYAALLARYSGEYSIPMATRVVRSATDAHPANLHELTLEFDRRSSPPFDTMLRIVGDQLRGWDALPPAVVPADGVYASSFAYWRAAAPEESAADVADLQLMIIDVDGTVELRWRYSAARFTAATIEALDRRFHMLLAGIAADPHAEIDRLPLMHDAERRTLLVEWNATAAPFASDTCAHLMFEEQARRRPDAVAVVAPAAALTYAELNARANRLAHHLQRRGVGPESLVGICVERSIEMIVAVLAVHKAGGAYVPLDPSYPADRLAFMIADAQLSLILTHAAASAARPALGDGPALIALDADWPVIAAESAENPTPTATPENLAYLIYTSGSTGRPKGVQLEHRGLVNLVEGQIRAFDLSETSRLLQFASFSFDASVSEIFTTLVAGGELHLAPRETLIAPPELLDLLRSRAITAVTLPPSLLAILPEGGLPALRTVVSAGESCSWEIARRWSAGRRFINAYGPTEATVGPTWHLVEDCDIPSQTVPIGRPLPNVQVYILDRNREPTPIGVPGEVYIGGVGLARGYLNRPELVAERFVANPHANLPGASPRLYRTGDLARFLTDGAIEFLGRIDHQVKLRGFRIELEEVEAVLRSHPAVQDAVALVREDLPGNQQLVGYVTTRQAQPIELWPSVAEYYVYDSLLYHAMTSDERRNEAYRVALRRAAPGKLVLDIGTGGDAILARLAVEAGARHVYAIELLEASYRQAQATIRSLGLEEKITLIHGDARTVELPELVDICVSEIVGAIGGSEGARQIINDAWRFLKPGGLMIPERSTTSIAAVALDEALLESPAFTPVSGHYVEQIFAQRGYPFDLRLCLRGVGYDHLRSTVGVLEDLDFTRVEQPEYLRRDTITVTKAGRIDGFLAWLNLYPAMDAPIDILAHEHCWLPIFFPVFSPGIEAQAGDRFELQIEGLLCDNQLNLDYRVRGVFVRQSGEAIPFEHYSAHYRPAFRQTPFYQRLFAGDRLPICSEPAARTLDLDDLRSFLQRRLPAFMVPSAVLALDALPLTPNGKVDRRALPAPLSREAATTYVAPRTPEEALLAEIWAGVLGCARVGIEDDFFALGGHSLLAARAITQITTALDRQVSLRTLFEAPTVAAFARAIGVGAAPTVTPATLAADVTLDTSIVPRAPQRRPGAAPAGILLTGATGFLGAFLLDTLLAQTSATIYCLVRAADEQQALQRLEATMNDYRIAADLWSRVVPVVGDLSAPRLGLSTASFAALAEQVDVIYHAGAQVHYLHSYATLKSANVGGSIEILRLACTGALKPVHYVSTLAVAASGGRRAVVLENDPLDMCVSPRGYDQSKWVVEQIMQIARSRGIPVTIYRPGRIGPHSRSGVANRDDFFVRFIDACVQLGAAPAIPLLENLVPVDYAAAAIVHLAQQERAANTTFHLLNREHLRWEAVVEALQRGGSDLTPIPYAEWRAALARAAANDPDLHNLLMLLPAEAPASGWIDGWADQIFDMRNTTAGLAGSDLHCLPIDPATIAALLPASAC
jgi:amino acid adenylation domain-containing protein/thioester reductase-like protein